MKEAEIVPENPVPCVPIENVKVSLASGGGMKPLLIDNVGVALEAEVQETMSPSPSQLMFWNPGHALPSKLVTNVQ